MERRGLNIRKSFLKVVLPVIRALPLPVASRFVSGIGRMEYRLEPEPAPVLRRGSRPGPNGSRLPVGLAHRESRTGGQSRSLANQGHAPGRRSRPAGARHVHGRRQRAPGRGDRAGQGMYRAGEPLRGPSPAGALAVPRELSGPLLHGTSAPYLAVHVAAFSRRTDRSGRTSCSSRGRACPPIRRARSSARHGRSRRGCCSTWRATSAGPGS